MFSAMQEAERVKAMDAKLAQLDIGGLVELTDDHAKCPILALLVVSMFNDSVYGCLLA